MDRATSPQWSWQGQQVAEMAPMPLLATSTIARRYAWSFAIGLAPVLLVLAGLLFWQYREQRAQLLDGLGRTALEQRLALESALKPASDHVIQLRRAAEAGLEGRLPIARSPLRELLRTLPSATREQPLVGLFLSGLDSIAGREHLGNVVAQPSVLDADDVGPPELDVALGLMEPMWLAHGVTPYLRWSYYLSADGDLAVMYPFARGVRPAPKQGYVGLDRWLAAWSELDVVRRARPDSNEQGAAFWTPPYRDAASGDWMVSHAAPVDAGARFAGVVGTDLLLSFFDELLLRSALPLGQAAIVDSDGKVLSTSRRAARDGGTILLADLVTPDLRAVSVGELLRGTSGFRRVGDSWLMAQPIASTPFHVIWAIPAPALTAELAPRFLPSALLVVGLVAAAGLVLWLLQHLFVRPALALVDHVDAESRGAARPLPVLPEMWQGLTSRVSQAFAAGRELSRLDAWFRTAAESLVDGLAVWDREDRLVYYNSRYPEHLTDNLRQVLGIGIRFEDWIRAGLELGPIYHPEMGADFVQRRFGLRRQPVSDHEHKLIDGRWVRLRESRMADGGRVLLTSDVTAAHEAEQRLRASEARFQAAAESMADGLAIFDSSGRLAYWNSRFPDHLMPQVRRRLGHDRPYFEIVRESLEDGPIYHPDMGTDFFERRLALRAQGNVDHDQHLADGRWLRLHESWMPDGGRVMLISDVTERHRSAADLAEQSRKLEAVISNMAEGLSIVDGAGRVVLVNNGFMDMYGFGPELARPGTPLAEFVRDRIRRGEVRLGEEASQSGQDMEDFVARRVAELLRTPSATFEEIRPDGRVVLVRRQRLPDDLLVSTYTDITERKQHERQLAILATAVEQAGDSVEIATPDYRLIFVNPAFTRLTGWTADEALGRTPAELLRSDQHDEAFFQEIDRTVRSGNTWKGRLISRHKNGSLIVQDATISPLRDQHGVLTHSVAVKRDVGDREHAIAALRESEERYRNVVEAQTEFVIRQRPDGTITFTNDAFCRHRGMQREQMLAGYNDLAALPTEARDEVRQRWSAMTPENPSVSYELRIPRSDGDARFEYWTDRAVFDEAGRVIEYQSVGRDITEQRRAEAARQASDRLRELVLEAALDCVVGIDRAGRIVEFNPAAERTFGFARADVLGRKIDDVLVPPAFRQAHLDGLDRHLSTGESWVLGRRLQLPALHADGHEFPVELVVVATDQPGGPRFLAYMRDITEQKRAEQAIRESEERYRGVVEAQTEFIVRMRPDGRLTFANDAYCRYMGMSREQLLDPGYDDTQVLEPEERQRYWQALRRLTPEQPVVVLETQPHLPGGRRPVEQWSHRGIFDHAGQLVEIQSVGRDITEQRLAEERLRASEERYRGVVEAQTEFVIRQRPDGRLTFVNDAYCRYYGKTREELLDPAHNDLDVLTPEERRATLECWARLTPEHPVSTIELHPLLPDGKPRVESWTDRGLFDAEGRLIEIQSVGREITEQRAAERALLASEERFRTIVEDQVEFITRFGSDFRFTFVNLAFARHLGRERESMLGATVLNFMTDQQAAQFRAQLAALTPEQPTVTYEMEGTDSLGRQRIEEWTDRALFDSKRRLVEYQSVGRDITDQRQAELALRESEERYRAVVQDQTEVIGRFDADFKLTFANQAHCRLLGRGIDELIGVDFFDSVPEPLASELRQDLLALTPENPVHVGENEKVLSSGERRWFAWTNRALFDDGERLLGYQAVGRDITEQKQAEWALRDSEAAMRVIAEGVPVPLAIARLDAPEILFTNERSAETFGLSVGPQAKQIAQAWVEGGDRERMINCLRTEGRVDGFEAKMRRIDGEFVWILFSARTMSYRGQPAFVAVMTDITDRRRMEEALRASEARLAAFMQHAPVGMYLKSVDGRYVMANPEMAKVFGVPAEEAIGRSVADFLPADEAAMIRGYDQRIIESGEQHVVEEFLEGYDAFAWTMVIRFPVRDGSGRITHIGGFDVDITAQKRAEQALRASEARLAAFMQHAPVGMYLKDVDGRYVLANSEMGKVFGRPAQEMIGRRVEDCLAERDLSLVRRADDEVLRTGGPVLVEEYTPDLVAYRWSLVFRFPLRDPRGNITHIGGFHVDNTAQKRAEAALRESEQRFRRFAEAHPVPLVVLRLRDTSVLFMNPAYVSMFGYPEPELSALDKHELWADPTERLPYLEHLRVHGEVRDHEVMLKRRDGTIFPASMSSRLLEYAGEPALVTSVIDLSRQKEAEAEVERQREALHQSEKLAALGSLLAGVAHELNNPLSVVVGYSSMLEELAPDEASRRRAERVHAAADRCARIVKAFLAMARQKPPKFGPVAPNQVMESALELAAYGLRTADIEVVKVLDPDLPPVWGDADQLHQVFTNLIVNAQHALQQKTNGPRRLLLRSRVRRGAVELTVGDNGPGMSPDVRKRIFEPFFSTKPQGMGTGVGLSLCHGIVTAHEGRIVVVTTEGKGSRFRVVLPFISRPVLPEAGADAPAVPAARGRVLVVDDETEIADLIREVLNREGYAVSVAQSGREALVRVQGDSFDVIISDLRMPDLDGPGLWRALKAVRPELADRMIFVTGDTLSGDASRFLREVEAPVMEKPLDLAELRRRVAEAIKDLADSRKV
jgi:PAS domain S-box-containing protein